MQQQYLSINPDNVLVLGRDGLRLNVIKAAQKLRGVAGRSSSAAKEEAEEGSTAPQSMRGVLWQRITEEEEEGPSDRQSNQSSRPHYNNKISVFFGTTGLPPCWIPWFPTLEPPRTTRPQSPCTWSPSRWSTQGKNKIEAAFDLFH